DNSEKPAIRSDALFPDEAHVGPPAIWAEQHHIVFFGAAALHPGRADRHAGHGKPPRLRLLGKKARQRGRWNVALDDISCDFRRVAGGEIVGDAEPSFHRLKVADVENFRVESRLLKVFDPTRAAAAGWILVITCFSRAKSVLVCRREAPAANSADRRVNEESLTVMLGPLAFEASCHSALARLRTAGPQSTRLAAQGSP